MKGNIPRKRKGGGRSAPLGNKNGVALKDPEIRQLAFKSYCDHLAKGKSIHSWYFEHGDYQCCYKTFKKYLENTLEFPPLKLDCAYAKGYAEWEQIAEESAKGINTRANTASLQMVLRNKFGWDKQEKEINVDVNFNKLFESMMIQLRTAQSLPRIADNSSISEQKS
jgi:hypothetical protein